MKKSLFLLLGVVLSVSIQAQDLVFRTLASKGTCMVQRGANPDEYANLKTGVKLFDNDKIIITGDNSYVGLVSSDGKTVELKKGGVYTVSDIYSGLSSNDATIAQKYVEFLVNDMSKGNESTSANMKFTGSVERSLKNDNILLFIPKETKVATREATINWYPKEKEESYTVVITNLFDEKVYNKEVATTSATIDFSTIGLSPDEVYKLEVRSTANPAVKSGVVTLQVPSQTALNTISKSSDEILAQTPQNSAIQNMVLAKYYDENGLYLNAIPFYKKAVEMEPEVKEYKNAYNQFLYKVGLNQES